MSDEHLLEHIKTLLDLRYFGKCRMGTNHIKQCFGVVKLMFKVIFLQRYYGLGDYQIQYQIIDRTSFRQFLGIHTVAEVPDEKTVWACKNKLAADGTFDRLFEEFRTYLDSKGLSFNEGKIIDATFIEAPKQRNTKEENEQIKAGNGKDLWNPEDGNSPKEKKRKLSKKSH